MKIKILSILILILTSTYCYSQDLITKKSNEIIKAKVIEVTNTEVKYKIIENLDGPSYVLPKSDLVMVKYESGTEDSFNFDNVIDSMSIHNSTNTTLFKQGQIDASKNYTKYKEAGAGVLITSLISPLVGLIPAIVCSSTQPKEINLNYPNSELMKKTTYKIGYTQKSKKIKQGKIWKNWCIGFGANLVAVLLLTPRD